MSQTRDSITSFVIVIIFLVLTAIATVLYGGSPEQKARLDNNFFWQKTRVAFDTAWGVLLAISNPEAGKGGSPDAAAAASQGAAPAVNWWDNLAASLKEAWRESGKASTTALAAVDDGSTLDWRKMAEGAEIVFKAKSGREYILSLPFKFLSQ